MEGGVCRGGFRCFWGMLRAPPGSGRDRSGPASGDRRTARRGVRSRARGGNEGCAAGGPFCRGRAEEWDEETRRKRRLRAAAETAGAYPRERIASLANFLSEERCGWDGTRRRPSWKEQAAGEVIILDVVYVLGSKKSISMKQALIAKWLAGVAAALQRAERHAYRLPCCVQASFAICSAITLAEAHCGR